MDEWISLKNKKPKLGQKVLLFSNKYEAIYIVVYDMGDYGDFWDIIGLDDGMAIYDNDYWMPLPKNPTIP